MSKGNSDAVGYLLLISSMTDAWGGMFLAQERLDVRASTCMSLTAGFSHLNVVDVTHVFKTT